MKKRFFYFLFLYAFTFSNFSKVFATTRQISNEIKQNEDNINFKYFSQKNFSNERLVFSNHPLIERFKTQYLNKNGLDYLAKVMQRSILYRDFIIELLEVYSMPFEFLFLPVIESGFNPNAVSRSGATGVWQFMKNSIGGYDISISEWLDERRDPWKTSVAAVKKLKYNYDILGDWCLALAAYNAGLAGIKKTVQRAGSNDFWYLLEEGYLKKETAFYVPKFLAVVEILMQSEQLGIDWGNPENLITTSTVDVKKSIDINFLEKELVLKKGLLAHLNPSLKFSITPPDQTYALRIPSEYTTKVQALLSSGKVLINHYVYQIKSGDTLYALAQHYGVSVKTIQQSNKGLNANALRIGQKILIPALKQVPAYKNENIKNSSFTSKYTVKQGDTLWSIALAHSITVEMLAEQNNISIDSTLKIGKVLLVP
ncbi:MAG: LysM peptidoglycan-binding domain-containing protein [Treponemataceae bacterium]